MLLQPACNMFELLKKDLVAALISPLFEYKLQTVIIPVQTNM